MAKFSACYQLCPLIDQKGFLGVTDESVNGCVIITLGKNMVIRFKLSDQKQVSSWSSKDKLTAPVVYDAVNQKYIGVFNSSQISTWDESCVQINNIKKHRFVSSIECVLTSPDSSSPVVVFRNGQTLPLHEALDKRKEPPRPDPPLSKDEIIVNTTLTRVLGSVTVAIFTTNLQGENHLHLIPLEEGLMRRSCLKVKRKGEGDLKLIGHTLVTHESCQLLTLWSDGQLFSLELPTSDEEQLPGRLLATLTAISPRQPAAILALSSTHLAIYGATASEEGALLFIFNRQLCVTQCRQLFKLYTAPVGAGLWAGGRAALLVAAAQHVTVVPYSLGKQRLAALVGSQDGDTNLVNQADWGNASPHPIKEDNSNKALRKIVKSYLEEGMSQRTICESLFLPTLDAKDLDGLSSLLETISDIPESCIISALAFCLKDIEQAGYRQLLRHVLSMPVTPDLTTLRLLRHRLSMANVLTLLKELADAMLILPADPQLVEWASLLLDAHYQKYLLSRNEAVVIRLAELKAVVDKQLEDLTEWQQLEPLLIQLRNKQGVPDPTLVANTSYSIEQITLY